MKKKVILSLSALSLFMLTGCSNFNLTNSKQDDNEINNEKTGNLVSGTYSFNSYDKFGEFYSVFVEKNTERFIVANFDAIENVNYNFECDGIDSKIIYDKIYNYDFPNPKFQIETINYCIDLLDVSSFIDKLNTIREINMIDNKENSKMKDVYANEYLIASLKYNFDLSTSAIQNISNQFVEALKNVC